MPIGQVLGRIGQVFAPPPANYRTPPFLPEDPNDPYAPDDAESQAFGPDAAVPPPAPNDESDNPPAPAAPPSPTTPPAAKPSAAAAVGSALKAPPAVPAPVAPAAPNTPGGQKIGLGRQIAGALIQGAGSMFRPTAGVAQILGQRVAQGSYPAQEREYERQMGIRKGQADLSKEEATAEETKARGHYYDVQSASTEAQGKLRPIPLKDGSLYDPQTHQIINNPKTIKERMQDYLDAGFDEQSARMLAAGVKPAEANAPMEIDPTKLPTGLQGLIKPDAQGRVMVTPAVLDTIIKGQAPKAPTGEENAERMRQILGKIPNLPASALTNVNQQVAAIRNAPPDVIPDADKQWAVSYLATKPTPATTGTVATIRMEGMGQMRQYPVLDTSHGNAPVMVSAEELNRASREEPGRYLAAGQGTQALNKTALIEDIRGRINDTRTALANLPEFSASDKAKIALALRDRDPRSAVSQLIGSAAGSSLTPAQQDYVINLAQLQENVMAMRSVLGAGQGSDDMRAAIMRTIPGPSTPNNRYGMKQLDEAAKTLDRVARGVPNVPLRNDGGQGGGGRGAATSQPSAPTTPTVRTKAEFDALPPGSEYINAKDNQRYRKP